MWIVALLTDIRSDNLYQYYLANSELCKRLGFINIQTLYSEICPVTNRLY